jgi:uncharacterized phiE125 gp8 family phage protein
MRLIPIDTIDAASLLLPAASGHARIDDGSAEDATIRALLNAAVEFVEAETRQQLFTARYELHTDGWPDGGTLTLPKLPLRDVDAVTYVAGGSGQQLPASQFIPDPAGSKPGRVTFTGTLASLDDRPNNVVVEFSAGYGETAEAIPHMLKQAVMLTFAHWFEHREAAMDRRVDELPLAVRSILNLHTFPEAI